MEERLPGGVMNYFANGKKVLCIDVIKFIRVYGGNHNPDKNPIYVEVVFDKNDEPLFRYEEYADKTVDKVDLTHQ